MDINVKWQPYTQGDWKVEVHYLTWGNERNVEFVRSDLRILFREIIIIYAKLLAFNCNIRLAEAVKEMHNKNYENFEQKMEEVFVKSENGDEINFSELSEILSSILVPKF